jgi:hypothetical protein
MKIVRNKTTSWRVIFLVACPLLLLILVGCAGLAPSPQLSRELVVRIADAEVLRVIKIDLSQFERPNPDYFEAKNCWYVPYRRHSRRYAEFTVQIDDRTREANLSMP